MWDSSRSHVKVMLRDVVVEVQQQRVGTPQELVARLEQLRRQNRPSALFLVENAQGTQFVALRLRAN